MKHFLFTMCCASLILHFKSQTTIYSESFEGSTTQLPTGWNCAPAVNGWTVSTSNNSVGYTGASGLNNVKIDNNLPTGTYSLITKSLSTLGYSNISVNWGARLTTNFPPSSISPLLYYSLNGGISWASVSYTETSSASVWSLNGPIALPTTCNNQSGIMFQLVANITNNTSGTYRIDDFSVSGVSQPTDLDKHLYNSDLKYWFIKNTLKIETPTEAGFYRVSLYDLFGNLIKESTSSETANSIFSLEGVNSGIYLLHVKTKKGEDYTKKLIYSGDVD